MTTPTLKREWRSVPTSAGAIDTYVAAPAEGKHPTVMLLTEIFGTNEAMREAAAAFAQQGFAVAVPDIFWRQETRADLGYSPEDRKRGFALMQGYDLAQGVDDIVAVARTLQVFPEFGAPVSLLGYCLGGKLAVIAGVKLPAAAIISFYGVKLEQNLDAIADFDGTLQIHVGDSDEHIPMMTVERLREAIVAKPNAELFVYEGAGHGFFNRHRTDIYAAEASQTALDRALVALKAAK